MDKDTLTWAAKAFASTALVLLAAMLIARPLSGRAQSDGAGIAPDRQADSGASPPGADSGGPRSNLEAMVPEETAPSGSDVLESVPDAAGYGSPLVIPAADFTSDGTDPDGFFFNFSGYVDGSGTACLKAPAYLPDGATVVEIWASLYDNASSDIYVTLRRVNVVTGSSSVMAEVSTAVDSTAIQQRGDTTIDYPEVTYPEYAYYVTTCLNYADHRLYSVRIHYTGP